MKAFTSVTLAAFCFVLGHSQASFQSEPICMYMINIAIYSMFAMLHTANIVSLLRFFNFFQCCWMLLDVGPMLVQCRNIGVTLVSFILLLESSLSVNVSTVKANKVSVSMVA